MAATLHVIGVSPGTVQNKCFAGDCEEDLRSTIIRSENGRMARGKECTEDSALRDDSELVLPGYNPLVLSCYESASKQYDPLSVTVVTPRRKEEVAKKVELERRLVTGQETTPRTAHLLGSDSERFSSLPNTKGGLNEPPKQLVGIDPPRTTVCACL